MKNKKILIILGLIIIIVVVLGTVKFIGAKPEIEPTPTSTQNNILNEGQLSGLEIKGEYVYYEYSGSSSVNRKSMIYQDKNGNFGITTMYFHGGDEKVVNEKLSEEQKDEILQKIKEQPIDEEDEEEKLDIRERPLGGSSFKAVEYISNDNGQRIKPIDLEELGYAQDVFDMF